MNNIKTFESFCNDRQVNEHVYMKAMSKGSKKWSENYAAFLKYLTKQIENRQLKEFKDEDGVLTFKIRGRKYKIDKKSKICLYKHHKGSEEQVELELTSDQFSEVMKALKKPLKSPKAGESTKKHPEGRKPYISED